MAQLLKQSLGIDDVSSWYNFFSVWFIISVYI